MFQVVIDMCGDESTGTSGKADGGLKITIPALDVGGDGGASGGRNDDIHHGTQ